MGVSKLVPSYCVLTMNFEEAVQFALERLHMEDLNPREEQLRSIKAVYDGQNVFVCVFSTSRFIHKFIYFLYLGPGPASLSHISICV